MTKPKLIIIEGSQGSGKSSVTTYLRENMLNTCLLRLAGLPKDKSNDSSVSYLYHKTVINLVYENKESGLSWVLDRSYISDFVYAQMGFKDYTFKDEFEMLNDHLGWVSNFYDIHLIVLTAEDNVYKERLNRNKAEYQKFSVESSIEQQKQYIKALRQIEHKGIYKTTIDTSLLDAETVGRFIMDLVKN